MSAIEDIKLLISAGFNKEEINALLDLEVNVQKPDNTSKSEKVNEDGDNVKQVVDKEEVKEEVKEEKPSDNKVINVMQKYNIKNNGFDVPPKYDQDKALYDRYMLLLGGEKGEK